MLENRCRLHLYCGTTEVLCRAVLLDREVLAPGEYAYAQLLLEEEAAFVKGDRFVVRFLFSFRDDRRRRNSAC